MSHSRRRFLQQLAGAGVAATTAPVLAAGPRTTRRKPNIVYFMSDELGYYELSCMGHPHFHTPNVDRLAAEGVRFTQGLAGNALCAPTRCCLLTGKHSGHTSVRTNGGGTPLRAEETTVATLLKRAGYATGGFGKWGCGGRGSTGVPEKHGFDEFFGYYDQVHAHSYYTPYLLRNSTEVPLPGNHGGHVGKTYSHYVIMDQAKKFIRANKDRPFFCYLPVTPPHGMFDIPDSDPAWALYQDKPWPEEAKRYAAMVNMVDRNVGEVVALLEELGLDQDTILFFCGDNGGMDYFRDKDHPRGFHGPNVDPKTGKAFRGHKGKLYEGGLRIPMIVRWPGHIQPGRVSDFLWYFPDFLVTAADLAGVQPPPEVDGLSILAELLGPQADRRQREHEYLYWELYHQTAVRQGRWKAIQPSRDAPWELYDLAADPEEKRNLAEDRPDLLAKLTEYAREAHQPVREGTFFDPALEEKDRRAKWGDTRPPQPPVHFLPQKGLIPSKDWRVVRVSSQSSFNGKLAKNAFDGDPRTIWHTQFQGVLRKPPHELVIDLGAEHTIRGFRYLARQDGGWNGTIRDCEFYVGNAPRDFGEPVVKAAFKKTKQPQEVRCAPVRGRYVMLRALSEIAGGPWASVAELGVIGK